MLRQLRALGRDRKGSTITSSTLRERLAEIAEWKRQNRVSAAPRLDTSTQSWASVRDLEHGEWALGYITLGVRCGRATGMHPVKIERVGLAQTERLEKETGAAGEERLASFYHACIESMQHALDEESVAIGRTLGTYEIFDVHGMRLSQLSLTTIRFARRMMVAFSKIFAETTIKVAVINLPWTLRFPVATIVEVLPERVKVKIHILGDDWESVLESDVDAEAMRLLRGSNEELARHRGVWVLGETHRVPCFVTPNGT